MKSLSHFQVVLLMLVCATAAVFAQTTTPNTAQPGGTATPGQTKKVDATAVQVPATNDPNKGNKDQNADASRLLTVEPAKLDFPSQAINSDNPGTRTVTVKNVSKADIVIQKVVAGGDVKTGGDFKADPFTPDITLRPDASMVIAVSFTPKREGNISGLLRIKTSQGDLPDIPLSGTTYQQLGGLCKASHRTEIALIFWVSLAYWLAMVVVRWNRIAHPTRELLRGQIATLRVELAMLPDTLPDVPPGQQVSGWKQQIAEVIEDASREMSPKAIEKGRADRLANFLFWSRGQEITGWGYVHDAESKMAAHQPIQLAVARLEAAEQQLRSSNDAPCLALANTIDHALTAAPPSDPSRLRALLAQALDAVNDRDDDSFADLVSWQNKASWLVGCGLFVAFMLTIAVPGHSILLVVGAAGGLISRMSRSLNRKDVPTDYGASWTTLFLSPVSGALGAWVGILVANLAVGLNILGPLFKIDFTQPCLPATLAIAFVFGFSERLLDGVLDKLDQPTSGTPTKNPQPAQKSAPTNVPGLTITTQQLDPGQVGQPYTPQLQASGGTGNLQWTVKTGSLPTGLTLTPAGSFTGTPTTPNPYTFTASVTDGTSTREQQLTIVVKA